MSEPTKIWIVTDKAGREVARVQGVTFDDAAKAAYENPEALASSRRDGGIGLRRLRSDEL